MKQSKYCFIICYIHNHIGNYPTVLLKNFQELEKCFKVCIHVTSGERMLRSLHLIKIEIIIIKEQH
jgi:hypothetical protein